MCRYAGQTDFVEVTSLNISLSGMLFRTPSDLPPVGSELEFKFILENGFELLSGSAQVMRHAGEPNVKPAVGVALGNRADLVATARIFGVGPAAVAAVSCQHARPCRSLIEWP